MTFEEEPPLHSTIPERPCTVALVQDTGLYTAQSTRQWQDELRQIFPNQQGITFANFEWKWENVNDDESGGGSGRCAVEQGMEHLYLDMAQLMSPHVVLVARGPLVGWISQLYLESFSLAGLVLVDPLPLDDKNLDVAALSQAIGEYTGNVPGDYEHNIGSIVRENKRSLLLEPGAVPTIILQSIPVPLFIDGARKTSDRHRLLLRDEEEKSEEAFAAGDAPIIRLDNDDKTDLQTCVKDSIGAWIESRVL